MKRFKILTRAGLLLVLLVLAFSGTVSALTEEQRRVFDSGSEYFNVQRSCVTSGGVLSNDGVMSVFYPGFVDEAATASAIEAFIRSIEPGSPWLQIPNFATRFVQEGKTRNVNPLLVVVIGRQESQFGTSSVASGNRNPPNYNSFGNKGNPDRNGDDYKEYPSFEASLIGEQSFFAEVERRLSGEHPNYANVKNMYDYLSVHLTGRIILPGDGTKVFDPTMGEWVDISGVVNYYNHAKEWIGQITGQTIQTSATGSASSCSSVGVVNGSIVQTALALAWTEQAKVDEIMAAVRATNGLCTMEGGDPAGCGAIKAAAGAFIKESDARPEYVDAVRQFNAGNDSDGANWAFSDCGVFGATVVRSSGVDPNYPARGSSVQLEYVQNNAAYDTVPFTDTSQLQPGDLLIKDGHVAIYVGPNQITSAIVVQASWGQHVPIANQNRISITPGDGYYRARKVGI